MPASTPTPAVGETLTPGAGVSMQDGLAAHEDASQVSSQAPASAVAAAICAVWTSEAALIHLASSDRRAEEIGRALSAYLPDSEILVLPPWDCLPCDRASPSRDVMGRRMGLIRALSQAPEAPRIIVTSPEALFQKLPPAAAVEVAFKTLRRGERLDRSDLARFAARTGYVADDRIDEPGEIAILGDVIDIFPADQPRPVRLVLGDDDVISELRVYDPLSQRSQDEVKTLLLGPASEWIDPAPVPSENVAAAQEATPDLGRPAGIEHGLAAHYDDLRTLFDLLPKARLTLDPKARGRLAQVEGHILEAFEARRVLAGQGDDAPVKASGLYLALGALETSLATWTELALDLNAVAPATRLAGQRNPGRAFCEFIAAQQAAGHRIAVAGLPHEQRALSKMLTRGLKLKPQDARDWASLLALPPGQVAWLAGDIEAGFIDTFAGVALIAAADVLGGRLAERASSSAPALTVESDLRIGDVVLHEDHGVAVLRDLVRVTVDGMERDTLQLAYRDEASLLVPIEDIGLVWRYGAQESAVTLDRLSGEAWVKRKVDLSRHIDETAKRLVALAKTRETLTCPAITPPKAAYARFAERFSYPETPDQAAAIEAVLADLASGRPMDRLVCGDVGFGKTEVALRAAAAVALSGRQVALAAPTTVLARQHFETFKRRFAGTDVTVVHLSRLVKGKEAKAAREALATGQARIVIGTQAVASQDMAFADLGLVIIDEEHKFGAALKDRLRALAGNGHRLTLTATPIPRTLQSAMIGVQEVSVIASPPARRRPIRTFLAPFDEASLKTALMRERRRGGQSFMVAPRIEDIAPLAKMLARIVPDLQIVIAHGDLPAETADAVMVGFADGQGDVLLATNIIESGLDVPRANTMVVWRPDRFGLAQLHQLRGRVGRGRIQGVAYLLSDPKDDLSDATRARLSTLEAFDRLGSGLEISAQDLDLRGAGELFGDDQAGHVRMIGPALYQRLLERAVRRARGATGDGEWTPEVVIGDSGSIPVDYVPDPVIRIGLYSRLARLETQGEIGAFEEELEDRFGSVPEPTTALLARARIIALAREAGARSVKAGPKGFAIALAADSAASAAKTLTALRHDPPLTISQDGDRVVVSVRTDGDVERRELAETLLAAIA